MYLEDSAVCYCQLTLMHVCYGSTCVSTIDHKSSAIVGMLGEAVKNPEMAQHYVNTHTHT